MRKNHNYFHTKMPEAWEKIVKFNQDHKFLKIPFVIYAETESLLEKIYTCDSGPINSFTSKIIKYTAFGYLLFTHLSFDNNKTKYDFCRGEDPIKTFCADLKEHATEIINFEKNEVLLLTEKQEKFKKRKFCHICKWQFNEEFNEDKNYFRSWIIAIKQGNILGLPIVSVI